MSNTHKDLNTSKKVKHPPSEGFISKENKLKDPKIIQTLQNNRQIIDTLKFNINHLKNLSQDSKFTSNNCSDRGSSKDPLFLDNKASFPLPSYKATIEDLQTQINDQEDVIQEYERSIQVLMASFRTGLNSLQEDNQKLCQSYALQLKEEKLINQNLTRENKQLRGLVFRLLNSLQNDFLDALEQNVLDSKAEISNLTAENSTLRLLLDLSNPSTTD